MIVRRRQPEMLLQAADAWFQLADEDAVHDHGGLGLDYRAAQADDTPSNPLELRRVPRLQRKQVGRDVHTR